MSDKEKIAIIIPPSPFLADERVFPFLGPLKVAAQLETQGQPVDVLDLSGISNYSQVVREYAEDQKDRVSHFGITATTPQFPQTVEIAHTIRQTSQDAKLILGGPHATLVGTAYLLDQSKGRDGRGTQAFNQLVETFDTTVIGDGELAILEAINGTEQNVIDAGSRQSEFFLQKGTLDNYPFPARHLIDLDSYHYQIDGKNAQSMIAQLGCPFECGFCGGRDTPAFRIARSRSTESIIAEVDELVTKYGYRGIMFYDDELNVSPNMMELMEDIVEYQQKNNIELRLRGFVKAELFDHEQAEIMHQAGFRILLSGVESGDRRILDTMKKHTTPEINSEWVNICHENGLQAKALMSIGHPGETEQTIMNSLQWVLDNKPDEVDWTIITQYPGSPYFDHSVPHPTLGDKGVWTYTTPHTGAVLHSKAVDYARENNYYKGVPGDYTSYVWTEELSPQRLVELRDHCEQVSRTELGLPQIKTVAAQQFEHSMGQGRELPPHILRTSIPK